MAGRGKDMNKYLRLLVSSMPVLYLIIVLAIVILAMSGCATDTVLMKEPVEVKVPVVAKCKVKYPDIPVWEVDTLDAKATIFQKGQALLRELEQRRQYERELLAVLKGCAQE